MKWILPLFLLPLTAQAAVVGKSIGHEADGIKTLCHMATAKFALPVYDAAHVDQSTWAHTTDLLKLVFK
jgi:hypothetical protein